MSEFGELGCVEVEALSAELALSILGGAERAGAVAHLASCASCRRNLEELSAVGDEILLLASASEPEVGFESRVMAAAGMSEGAMPAAPPTPPPAPPPAPAPAPDSGLRLSEGRAGRRLPRARIAQVAAAVAFTALVATGGLLTGMAMDDGRGPVRTALAVSANGRATCRAMAYGDKEAWVFVTMEAPPEWNADYSLEITTVGGGAPAAVGTFRLVGGQGTFSTTVGVPASRLLAVRLLDGSGSLRYEAPFAD